MTRGHQPGFGRRLRELRVRACLTQADLASSDITQSYVSHLEAGRREPTWPVVVSLARRLSVGVEDLLGSAPTEELASSLLALGHADREVASGRLDEAEQRYRAAVRDPLLHGTPHADRALLGLAGVLERRGDLSGAIALLEPLHERTTGGASDAALVSTTLALSRCYREGGDLMRAVDVGEAGLRCLADAFPRPAGYAQLVATVAFAYAERGDLLRASHLLDALLAEVDSGQDREARAAAYWNASLVQADRGRLVEALALVDRAGVLLAEHADERALARIKVTKAWLLLSPPLPDPEAAGDLLRSALPDLRRHAGANDVASALTELARVSLALGQPEEAARHARQALTTLQGQEHTESARAGAVLGQALLLLGDAEGGRLQLDRAARLLEGAGATRECAALWRSLGEAYRDVGATDQALAAFGRAMDVLGLAGPAVAALPVVPSGLNPEPSTALVD